MFLNNLVAVIVIILLTLYIYNDGHLSRDKSNDYIFTDWLVINCENGIDNLVHIDIFLSMLMWALLMKSHPVLSESNMCNLAIVNNQPWVRNQTIHQENRTPWHNEMMKNR